MAEIGQTTGGRPVSVEGAPYDNAAIILPNYHNRTYIITQNLTGNLTAARAGNSDTPQTDWGNGMHLLRSGNLRGQGTIPVVEGSDADKVFFEIYNKLHPESNSGATGPDITQAYHDFEFTLYAWKSDETDANGNPTKYVKGEYCFFTNQPQSSLSNGTSNNSTPDSWTYTSAELTRHMGKPKFLPDLD